MFGMLENIYQNVFYYSATRLHDRINDELIKLTRNEEPDLAAVATAIADPAFHPNLIRKGMTILDHAIRAGSIDIARRIINSSKINQVILNKALYKAVSLFTWPAVPDLAKRVYIICIALIDAGARPEEDIIIKLLPLDPACFDEGYQIAKRLLDLGADVNVYEHGHGYSILDLTTMDIALIKLFLKYNVNPELSYIDSRATALMSFVSAGGHEACLLLINYGADLTMQDADDRSVIDYSRKSKFPEIKHFIDELMKRQYPELSDNATLQISATAEQVRTGLEATHDFFRNVLSNPDGVRAYLASGNNIHVRDEMGKTALFYAYSNLESAQLLIDYGIDLNAQNNLGETAIFYAPTVEMAQLLVKHGADPKIKTYDGRNLLYAIIKVFDDREEDRIRYYLSLGLDPHERTAHGHTILHKAALWGRENLVNLFIELGLDVNAQDIYGKTPLHRAAQKEEEGVINILLKAGADPTIRCRLGKIPLDHAHKAVTRELLTAAMRDHADTLPSAAASHEGADSVSGKKRKRGSVAIAFAESASAASQAEPNSAKPDCDV